MGITPHPDRDPNDGHRQNSPSPCHLEGPGRHPEEVMWELRSEAPDRGGVFLEEEAACTKALRPEGP